MKKDMKRTYSPAKAFTLIEILTVIAIVGVLAALLFPAIKGALQKAEIAQAQNDIKNIESAAKMFYTEYGKWPNPWPSSAGPINDFSYGAFGNSGSYTPNASAGYCENYWLMNILRGIQDTGTVCGNGGTPTGSITPPVNSRSIPFLAIPQKSLKLVDPNHGYYDYVDPWGNPYQITVDTSYDNICSNLARSASTGAGTPVNASGSAPGCVSNQTVVVWSFGPLGPYGTHTLNPKDWITSWQ
jgi:prepilin-type N-terminal cleavage/methylation domain-containing protein